jgi:hypothetical protein
MWWCTSGVGPLLGISKQSMHYHIIVQTQIKQQESKKDDNRMEKKKQSF